MRRRAVIAPILLAAAALLAWRRRRARLRASLGAAPAAPTPLAPLPAAQRALTAAAPSPATLPTPAAPASPPDSPFVSVPWTLVAAPADRAELTVRYAAHPRFQLDRVDAQETPTQVFVTVLLRPNAAAAGGPADSSQEHEATVALSGPLGSRALIHAPADAAAPVGGEPNGPSVYP